VRNRTRRTRGSALHVDSLACCLDAVRHESRPVSVRQLGDSEVFFPEQPLLLSNSVLEGCNLFSCAAMFSWRQARSGQLERDVNVNRLASAGMHACPHLGLQIRDPPPCFRVCR
jgi:hypothetical protein